MHSNRLDLGAHGDLSESGLRRNDATRQIILAQQEEGQGALCGPDLRRASASGSRSAALMAFRATGQLGAPGGTCLLCGTPVPLSYIREEGKAGRMGAQLMAIAAEGTSPTILRCTQRGAREGG